MDDPVLQKPSSFAKDYCGHSGLFEYSFLICYVSKSMHHGTIIILPIYRTSDTTLTSQCLVIETLTLPEHMNAQLHMLLLLMMCEKTERHLT